MPKFTVFRKEIYITKIEIEADSPDDAIFAAAEGSGTEVAESRYHGDMDVKFWYCEDSFNDPYYYNKATNKWERVLRVAIP